MRTRLVIIATALVFGAVACSVVDSGKVSRLDPPGDLGDTLASTTTAAPTTTQLVTTTSGLETTTTGVQTEQVRLYFIASGQLTYVSQPLPAPVALPVIIAALQSGPQGDLQPALRTAVPARVEIRVFPNGAGVASVELPENFFNDVAVGDQRLVIGQIVLTLTDSRGIGQVQFNQVVPKPSGENIQPGQLLTRLDYEPLLDPSTIINDPGSSTTTTTLLP